MRVELPGALLMLFVILLLPAAPAAAQWHDDTHPIGLTPPNGWTPMSASLLTEVNRTVRHVTDGVFHVGYQAHEGEALLFPYLLVQYEPYDDLPEDQRPTYRLDERDTLQLIARLVRNFGAPDTLPVEMTADAFAERYDRPHVQLGGVGPGGTFELTGTVPLQDGGQLEYVTLGRVGREGVAFVSVFTNEGLDTVRPVVDGAMRTLAFDEGAGFDALPEREPEVAGFLPPPAEPLPGGSLLAGDGAFCVLPGAGYVPLPGGSFEARDPGLVRVLPEALRGVAFEQVLTRTPTSRRITRPWAAAALAPLEALGLGDALSRRPTQEEWAGVLAALVGVDPGVAALQLERLAADPAYRVAMSGPAEGDDSPWRVESVAPDAGRVALSRRMADPTDASLLTRLDLTLVVGRAGVAVLLSESYTDAAEDDVDGLAAMHASVRFVGGERLVDVPPAGEGGAETGEGAGDGMPNNPTPASDAQGNEGSGATVGTEAPDTASAPQAAAPATAGDATAATTDTSGSGLALPLILGVFAVVFVGVVVVVVFTSHAKAKARREKARARRERQAAR